MTLSLVSGNDDLDLLSFEIAVLEDALSNDEFPILEISVENVGGETATWKQTKDEFAFPARSVPGGGLVLGSEDEVETRVLDGGGCARVERGIDREDVLVETTLKPGDSIEQRYGVAGSDEKLDDRCPDPGPYRTSYRYGDHGSWGFRFELDDRVPSVSGAVRNPSNFVLARARSRDRLLDLRDCP